MTSTKKDDFLNQKLGDYILKEIIAVGGMARVYLAEDENLGRQAAVKVLDLRQEWVDDNIIGRFEREARAVAPLEHPNIITIWAYGTEHDSYFQAMQYIPGSDLRHLLKDYRDRKVTMPVNRVIHITQQVASALDYAHQRGIIHRDIKPSNVLLRDDDTAILTDFGLVLRNDDSTMGTAFGTPRYIAPEQAIASQHAVPQSDIYAFAVIMYEMLTGDTPFDGDTPMEIALAHVSDEPDKPSKRNPKIPLAVDRALMRALAKEPHERFETATEFVEKVAAGFGIVLNTVGTETSPTLPPSYAKRPTPNHSEADMNSSPVSRPTTPAPRSETALPPSRSEPTADAPPARTPVMAIAGGIVVLLIGIVAAVFLSGGGDNGIGSDVTLPVNEDAAEIVLTYDGQSFTIYNGGDYTLTELSQLDFINGQRGDGNDYPGERIPGGEMAPGSCHIVQLQGAAAPPPSDCEDIGAGEILSDPSQFHWRSDDQSVQSFEVRWGNTLLTTCDTIRRGEEDTCRFTFPLPPPA